MLQNAILTLLVLLLVLQAFYLLVLELVYPQNTGIGSAYRMLRESLTTQSPALSGELREPQELRELWPSSVALLSAGEDRAAYFSGAAAGPVESTVNLVAEMLEKAELQQEGLGYEQLLQQDGLLLDLGRTLPLDIAMALAQHGSDSKQSTRRLLLTQSGSMLYLSLDGAQDRLYSSGDSTLLARYQDCRRALSDPKLTVPVAVAGRGSQQGLLPPGALSSAGGKTPTTGIQASNPFETMSSQIRSAVREAFSFSANVLRESVEADGSIRYTENNSSLTLSPDGLVSFRATDARYGISMQELLQIELDSYTAVEVIQAGYALYEACLPLGYYTSSEGGLRYSGAQWQDNRLTLYYDYVVCGLPVLLQRQAHAMTLQYDSGFFTSAQLLLRGYELAETYYPSSVAPLVALAERQNEGETAAFELVYRDGGEDVVLLPQYRLTRGGDRHVVD